MRNTEKKPVGEIFSRSPVQQVVAGRWLRSLCLSTFVLASSAGVAAATDLLAADGPEFDGAHELYCGAYIGASVGYGWGESHTTYDRNDGKHETAETIEPDGMLGSLTFGYNHRLSEKIVVGVEGDIGVMDMSASDKTGFWDDHIWKSQYGGLWGTLRARAGYLFGNTLLYGTGGLAFMQTDEYILGDNDATQNTYNEDFHTGWVLGAGVEHALTERTSIKLEYLHMDFGDYESTTNNAEPYSFDNEVDLVRVGVNYKF